MFIGWRYIVNIFEYFSSTRLCQKIVWLRVWVKLWQQHGTSDKKHKQRSPNEYYKETHHLLLILENIEDSTWKMNSVVVLKFVWQLLIKGGWESWSYSIYGWVSSRPYLHAPLLFTHFTTVISSHINLQKPIQSPYWAPIRAPFIE